MLVRWYQRNIFGIILEEFQVTSSVVTSSIIVTIVRLLPRGISVRKGSSLTMPARYSCFQFCNLIYTSFYIAKTRQFTVWLNIVVPYTSINK